MPASFRQSLFDRYRELQRYVDWAPADARRVQAAQAVAAPSFPVLIDDFYAEIDRHPQAGRVITGGEQQVDRLKQSLFRWLEELFSGEYDADYAERRWQVGCRHVEIGLSQVYTNVALSRLRRRLLREIETRWTGSHEELLATIRSVNTLIDLDLAIIEEAYRTEYLERQQRSEQALQAERLAAIGQMSAGLAHESRNALQRSKAALEMLALEVDDRPEALDLVQRLAKAQDHLHKLYEEVRGYAAPINVRFQPVNIAKVLIEAWDALGIARRERDVVLLTEFAATEMQISGDPFALEQVFRNILENAIAACPDPGEIRVVGTEALLEGRPAIRLSIRDNGPGLNAEQRVRIFEPFYTTKTRGTGLGMAISKRIVEAHHGCIEAGRPARGGAEIIIQLPITPKST